MPADLPSSHVSRESTVVGELGRESDGEFDELVKYLVQYEISKQAS